LFYCYCYLYPTAILFRTACIAPFGRVVLVRSEGFRKGIETLGEGFKQGSLLRTDQRHKRSRVTGAQSALRELGQHPRPTDHDVWGGRQAGRIFGDARQADKARSGVDLDQAGALQLGQRLSRAVSAEANVLGNRASASSENARHLAGELAHEQVQVHNARVERPGHEYG
jgi:hypothetical protein